MPWGALERPALGISLLKSGLQSRPEVACEARYLNMRFADVIGAQRYQWITHELPHVAFAGEWLFTESLYGSDPERDRAYLAGVLRRTWKIAESELAALKQARRETEGFLERMLEEYDWNVNLVGFTSTFEQNVASLALAMRIKQRFPETLIAFGGANWESDMGAELHRLFSFVDLCCSGEADASFVQVVDALRAPQRERAARLRKVRGIVFRDGGQSVSTGPGVPVEEMDALPVPSYDEYFGSRQQSAAAMEVAPVLLFEASRGCWWGAKSHCTFCGLNGNSMRYRSKSAPRLVRELGELIGRWPCHSLEAVDNILDMHYFDSVLPALERLDLPGPIFFEVKANLRRHHVAALKRANILRIQPGIESLSDHVLKLMRKGTTALRNVQLLKWAREYGISVDWNLLYGFPGETDEDYRKIIALLPRITHLQMPGACGAIRLDRFSPYFVAPEEFGLRSVRPLDVYRYIYPLAGARLERIAYYFDFDYASPLQPSATALEAARLADSLREIGNGAALQALPCRDGGIHLRDTRARDRAAERRFSNYERCILERIDEVASLGQVVAALRDRFPDLAFDAQRVHRFLDELVSLDIALTDDAGNFLGLALMTGSLRPTLERSSRRGNAKERTIPIVAQRPLPALHG